MNHAWPPSASVLDAGPEDYGGAHLVGRIKDLHAYVSSCETPTFPFTDLCLLWCEIFATLTGPPPSTRFLYTYLCSALLFLLDLYFQDWRKKIWLEKEKKMSESMKECVNKGAHEITGVLQHGVINILDPRISCPLALSVKAKHMLQSYASVFPMTPKQTGDKHQALQSQVLLSWTPLWVLHNN